MTLRQKSLIAYGCILAPRNARGFMLYEVKNLRHAKNNCVKCRLFR
nr:MAG TPA: hypothetical protein [Caudoviricetes sp.]